jgi:hypothetical protein
MVAASSVLLDVSGAIGALAETGLETMTKDQIAAIRANVGGPRTCERWAQHWTARGAAAHDTATADVCYANAQTLRAAAHAMRGSHVALIGGAR